MQVELMYQSAYTLGRLRLQGGEQVRVESASMVGMSTGMTLETTTTGGFMQSLKRSLLGGESLFQNVYTAPAQGGEVVSLMLREGSRRKAPGYVQPAALFSATCVPARCRG